MIGRGDFEQHSFAGGLLSLSARDYDNVVEHDGFFACEAGLVAIWTARFASGTEWTVLYAVARGRTWRRDWRRCWHRHTLPALCRQFLADIEACHA